VREKMNKKNKSKKYLVESELSVSKLNNNLDKLGMMNDPKIHAAFLNRGWRKSEIDQINIELEKLIKHLEIAAPHLITQNNK
jgi:hypothetical protein